MERFTFLHAADLHLDTPFEGLGREVPGIAAALRDASLDAFDRLVALALEEQVAFALFAGDIYDGPQRGVRAQLHFYRGLERLAAAGIPSFIVHGNHDPVEEGWTAIRSWPEGVHTFAAGEVEQIPVHRDGVRLATIHGTSFAKRAETENLARRFARGEAPGFHVGLLHTNAGGQPGHDAYAPCGLEDLRAARLDYWALGHIHLRQTLLQGDVWAHYPGNLQGRSFKASERGSKGASLVHVEAGRVVGIEHRGLAPIRFEHLRLDVGAHEDFPAIQRALLEAGEALAESGAEGTILSAELVGRSPLHAALLREQGELRESLEAETAGGTGWIHWARLEVRTSPAVDGEALRERKDLLGTLLRKIDALRDDEDGLRTLLQDVDKPLARLKGWEDAVDEPAAGLLDAAEADALARLLEEG